MASVWRKFGVFAMIALVLAGSVHVTAGNPARAIGHYEMLGITGTLTESHVSETPDGIVIRGPEFSSQLRVNAAYLQEAVGDWSTEVEFSENQVGEIVVDGRDIAFDRFDPGQEPSFTYGSSDSIRFLERPMGSPFQSKTMARSS